MRRLPTHRAPTICAACLAAWLALLSPLTAMASAPPISYLPERRENAESIATLYFRFRDSALLVQEERVVTAPRTGAVELSVIQELINGPSALSPYLHPLFPPGAEALSVHLESSTLYVTFNEALMAPYADETPLLLASSAYREGEGALRRRLAMASLANTLTETGRYRQVQVLVRAETSITASMRLNASYYLEDSRQILPPLTRNEGCIMTPERAAGMLLDAWQKEDWATLHRMVTGSETRGTARKPSENEVFTAFSQAPQLLDYAVTPGTVSPDGQSAVVCADLELRSPGGYVRSIAAYPLKLLRQEGIWQSGFDTLLRMAEEGK